LRVLMVGSPEIDPDPATCLTPLIAYPLRKILPKSPSK
jgi:hypothetical protein